jgi:hypothetical protein
MTTSLRTIIFSLSLLIGGVVHAGGAPIQQALSAIPAMPRNVTYTEGNDNLFQPSKDQKRQLDARLAVAVDFVYSLSATSTAAQFCEKLFSAQNNTFPGPQLSGEFRVRCLSQRFLNASEFALHSAEVSISDADSPIAKQVSAVVVRYCRIAPSKPDSCEKRANELRRATSFTVTSTLQITVDSPLSVPPLNKL